VSDGHELTIRIHVAGHLRDYTGRPVELEIQGAKDILDVIAQLDERVPHIRDRIFDEHDRTRPFINIYVNEEDIRDLESESTKTKDGDVIYILPSVAGGKGSLSAEGGWTR
jgi:MoaD family protein